MKKKLVALMLAGAMAFSMAACGGSDEAEPAAEETQVEETEEASDSVQSSDTQNTESSGTDVSSEEPEQVIAPYETDLTCGYYMAGIHIPEGVYNISVNSGIGNIMTKTGVTSALGSGAGVEYADSYSNLTLQNGDVLTVTQSLNIHISTEEAYYSSMSPYTNPATEEKELGAGSYVVGQDIQAGVYDVSIVSGDIVNLNTSDYSFSTALTSNDTLKGSTATDCKNVELIDGQTLSVSSGTVKLTPCADNEPLTPQ